MRALPPLPALALLALLASAACGRPEVTQGGSCERNSDCLSPLVCEVGRCRRQCLAVRDCPAGLRCLPVSKDYGGVCQLPAEATCALNSDCPAPLVCQMGTCSVACAEDRDCLEGTCEADGAGALACLEPEPELCVYNSDCAPGLVCGADQVCREECLEDRDCRYPRVCDADAHLCVLVRCAAPAECDAPRACVEGFCTLEPPVGGGT